MSDIKILKIKLEFLFISVINLFFFFFGNMKSICWKYYSAKQRNLLCVN